MSAEPGWPAGCGRAGRWPPPGASGGMLAVVCGGPLAGRGATGGAGSWGGVAGAGRGCWRAGEASFEFPPASDWMREISASSWLSGSGESDLAFGGVVDIRIRPWTWI